MKRIAALSGGKDFDSVQDFCDGDRGDDQFLRNLNPEPAKNCRLGRGVHQLGNDIGIKDNHGWVCNGRVYFYSLSHSGSGTGSRGKRSSSTPPNGSQIARICLSNSAPLLAFWRVASLRISRTSSSIDRPFLAARIFSCRFVLSEMFRTSMLAMQSMIALLSLIAQDLARAGILISPCALRFLRSQCSEQEVPMSSLSAESRKSHISHYLHSP